MKSPVVLLLLAASSVLGQGTFQNLGFECPVLPLVPNSFGFVAAADGTPGWTPYVGTNATALLYNNLYLGTAVVDLIGPEWTNSPIVIDGSYSVVLQAGLGNSPGSPGGVAQTEVSIRQTGLVPLGTQSILFKAQAGYLPLSVTLAGQSIPFFAMGTGSNYTLYGGDISAFGGQTAELRFTALPPNDNWTIDSIEFSSQAVPEPSVLTLFALGSVLFTWRFLRQTHHQLS
jgi:hypothetical protein